MCEAIPQVSFLTSDFPRVVLKCYSMTWYSYATTSDYEMLEMVQLVEICVYVNNIALNTFKYNLSLFSSLRNLAMSLDF